MSALDLAALPEGSAVVVRGLAGFVGRPVVPVVEPEETWEALCARISRPERGPFRVRVTAAGVVL